MTGQLATPLASTDFAYCRQSLMQHLLILPINADVILDGQETIALQVDSAIRC